MNISKAARLAAVTLVVAATSAGTTQIATAATTDRLTSQLGEMWTTVLQTPDPQNPFGSSSDPADACWNLDGNVVAPFGPSGAESCTVGRRTAIFVVGASGECSTPFEVASGTDLAACARDATTTVKSVRVDGNKVSLSEVLTPVLPITLPAKNVFGVRAHSQGQFVAAGWVTELEPLAPGEHTIAGSAFNTTIVVQ